MVRMGHDSERAAVIYLHSSDKRQRALADAVAKAARAELPRPRRLRSRADLARGWHETSKTVRKIEPVSGFEPLTVRLQGGCSAC